MRAWLKKVSAWWKKQKIGDKVAILALVVSILGLLNSLGLWPGRQEPSDKAPPTSTTATREPLEITVQADPGIIDPDISTEIVIPRGRTIVGGPRDCGEFQTWANQYGGVPTAESSQIRITLQGGSSQPIVISSMKARVVERRRPLVGTSFTCGGEGELEPKKIVIDLDKFSPTAIYSTKKGPKKFSFELRKDETLQFDLEAHTLKCYCKWVIDLKVIIGGKSLTRTIQDNGRPFEITPSRSNGQYYFWAGDRWQIRPGNQKEWPFDRPIKT